MSQQAAAKGEMLHLSVMTGASPSVHHDFSAMETICGGCSMLRDNFRREELCDGKATQRDHYPVIAISHYRNEIRQQVNGTQSISNYTYSECPHMPWHTTVT